MEGTEEEQPTSGKRKQREKSCTGNHVKKRRLGDKTQARRFFELRERRKKTVCFGCRKLGHSLKECPAKEPVSGYCFNCGKTGHISKDCPSPTLNGGASFASCFICKQKGHLAAHCPTNSHGVYVNGGCCHSCGAVDHYLRDCPKRTAGTHKQGCSEESKPAGSEQERAGTDQVARTKAKQGKVVHF